MSACLVAKHPVDWAKVIAGKRDACAGFGQITWPTRPAVQTNAKLYEVCCGSHERLRAANVNRKRDVRADGRAARLCAAGIRTAGESPVATPWNTLRKHWRKHREPPKTLITVFDADWNLLQFQPFVRWAVLRAVADPTSGPCDSRSPEHTATGSGMLATRAIAGH